MTDPASAPGRLMDAATIMRELGITRGAADRAIRWCNENGAGAIRPVDGARKLYVERSDIDRWIEQSRTRDAA